MKLLSKPTYTQEQVTLGGPRIVKETRVNPLGLLGIGPLVETRNVEKRGIRSMTYPGRISISPVGIDLEDDLEVFFKHGVDRFPAMLDRDLDFEGVNYRLFGILPLDHIEGRTWCCHINYYEVLK